MVSQVKKSTAPISHGRTAARIAKIKLLIDALRNGNMLRDEIGEVLGFGPSGTRKYIKELREAQVMEIARYVDGTDTFLGHALYCLVNDVAHVDKFIADLPIKQVAVPRIRSGPPTNLELAQRDASRHFHIMADDAAFAVRVSRAPIMRDPMVAALFGAGRAPQREQVAA